MGWLARALGGVALASWGGWASLAVLLGGAGPNLTRVTIIGLGAAVIAGLATLQGWRPALGGVLAGCALTSLWFSIGLRPKHDRVWAEDQVLMPRVTFDGDVVTIENHRSFRYRSETDWDADWTTETFDLRGLVGADLGVEHFSDLEAVAHTFVSFRFADGRVLVASVEIRKELGESFSPLKGLFRQYELMIVLGDERDLVELRAVHRGDTVYLHPLDLPGPRVAEFLRVVLEDAARLHDRPQFYNTFSNSCSSTLARHLRSIEPVGLDYRMFMPGYTDALAHDLGWLAGEGSLADHRERNTIDARARESAGQADFSARIRSRVR